MWGLTSASQYGIYKINIHLHHGSQATMSGVCLDKIIPIFPTYPLQGINDIINAYQKTRSDIKTLTTIPKSGEIYFMFDVKYSKCHPKSIFQLPSGLTIYKSVFENADGGRLVIGGPRKVFNSIRRINLKTTCNLHFFQISMICIEMNIR